MGAHLHVPSPLPLMAMQALVIQAGERLAQVMSELLTHRCRKWVMKSWQILPEEVGIITHKHPRVIGIYRDFP